MIRKKCAFIILFLIGGNFMGKKYLKPEEVATRLVSQIQQSQGKSPRSYQIVFLTRQEVAKHGGRAVAKDAFMRDVAQAIQKNKAIDTVELKKNCEEIHIYPDAEIKSFTEIVQESDESTDYE